jgi:hypothetical protein
MKLVTIIRAAPATPPCFPDRDAWIGYLATAQACNKQTPFFNGVFRLYFGFCEDCTRAHSAAMSAQGKCNPSFFRANTANTANTAARE